MRKHIEVSREELTNDAPTVITRNPIMLDLISKVKLAAKTGAKVLLTGENGTGKEIFAQLLHYYGNHRDKPMLAVNCGAIASELVESELFGHEKGAFTGAIEQKKGCFELADGGTLFLDEIGEMPLSMQVKLLRVVETGSFRRVGGREELKVDLNLITASNKILVEEVKFGSFREDLYYRINVIELYLPPLRHRKDDIPPLLDYYANYFADRYGLEEMEWTQEYLDQIMEYDWPGNVRELKNVIERSIVLSGGEQLGLSALPPRICKDTSITPRNEHPTHIVKDIIHIQVGTSLEDVERKIIDRTLSSVNNNKTEAAKILGFSRKTLHNKLDKYKSG